MILFLDLDGVLHGLNGTPFSKRELLWQILRAVPSLDVVITSSWREQFSLAQLADRATAGGGEDLRHRFAGMTPILKEARKAHRQAEITAWLETHDHAETRWLALDDDPQLFDRTCLNLHICKVSGLSDQDVATILDRLKCSS